MRRVILFTAFAAAAVVGCTDGADERPPEAVASMATGAFADAEVTGDVMGLWSRSCVLCHVHGEAGAPRLGDTDAWAPRLARGEETLLTRTVEGYNDMPPLGYCMACEREDFRALIRLMAEGRP